MPRPHVICAGPDEEWRQRVTSALTSGLGDVTVAAAADPESALAELDAVSTRALVSAPRFPDADWSGAELLGEARERAPDVACIIFGDLSAADDAGDTVVEAVDASAADATDQLVTLVERAIEGRSHAAYPVPDDEPERVGVLADLPTDDDRLRVAFDRLADLAAATFDADYAYVSAMHAAEQEHVACHGFEPTTMDRERSICAYTVAADEVTVIESVDTDPRFDEEEYVADLDLGWYAGAPIRVSGRVVGTLCVLGRDDSDDVDHDLLQAFADEAADQFEFARLRN